MSLYLIVPLVACVSSAAMASILWNRDPRDPAGRNAVLLLAGNSFWAGCEILFTASTDPASALFIVKLSVLGWVGMPPIALRLFLEVTGDPAPRIRRALPVLMTVPLVFLVIQASTPWLVASVFPTPWGWGYRLGPAYLCFYAFATACVVPALWLGIRAYIDSPSEGERVQARMIGVGLAAAVATVSITDGFLPMAGVGVPRLGVAGFSLLGLAIVWCFHRYGYSLVAVGSLASEILETLPDGVAMSRLDGRIRSANSALARMVGCGAAELVDVDASDLIRGLGPDLRDGLDEVECELQRSPGEPVPVSLSSTVFNDRQGGPIGIVWVARDLREVAALRGRLVVSGRLAAVGELAAGIAHEINNPLAYVRANLSLLREHWNELNSRLEKYAEGEPLDDLATEGEEMIDESLEGVDRASAIVRDVKGLAHAGRGQRVMADVNELLDGVLRIAAPQLRDAVQVEKHYGSLPPIVCAPQELQQVFLNLIINARQAISGDGTIRLRTRTECESVAITVEDDGVGIPDDLVGRIFDPFFTTKAVGEGSGLGLGIAHEIVRRHHGEIDVTASPEGGAAFCVRIPIDVDTIEAS